MGRPVVQTLERRRLLVADFPTPTEQYLVELINRARADPAAEAVRDGIDLNEGLPLGTISPTPKQPLAINPNLTDAAGKHSQWMIDNDVFAHNEGSSTPQQQMSAAGYSFTGSWASGQNIAWRGQFPNTPNLTTTTAQMHDDLFIDSSVSGRGHRLNLMNNSFREVGAGALSGDFLSNGTNYHSVLVSEDFAKNSGNASGDSFLTGVAFTDSVTHDSFYTIGEGIGGATITAVRASDGAAFTTTTWSSGGYGLRLNAGTYTITASGTGFASPVLFSNVVIGSSNIKRDFVSGTGPSAPVASAGTLLVDTSPLRLSVKFSESVAASLASGDLQLRASGSSTLIPVNFSSYDSASNTATFTIPQLLADGNYRATISAAAVSDVNGHSMAADYSFDIFCLAGDVNRDRSVDAADVSVISANFGRSGRTFTQGDMTYDGRINSIDFCLLAHNFGTSLPTTTLPAPAARVNSAASTAHSVALSPIRQDLIVLIDSREPVELNPQ